MFDQRRAIVIALGILFLLSFPLSGQQSYVTRFDFYAGYGFLDSPKVNLFENGAAFQIGFRPTTWLSLGFDYNVAAGNLSLTPAQLLPALQTELQTAIGEGIAAGVFPPPSSYNYAALYVPAHSKTQTFALGPELVYRHFSKVTLFVRPVYAGIIHETATPKPQDPVVQALVVRRARPARPDTYADQDRQCLVRRFRRRLRHSLRQAFRLENAGRHRVRSPVPRPVAGRPPHRALLLRPAFNFGPNIRGK